MRLTVRMKILGGFGLVLLLTAGLGIFALNEMGAIEHNAETLYEKHTLGTQYILTANIDTS